MGQQQARPAEPEAPPQRLEDQNVFAIVVDEGVKRAVVTRAVARLNRRLIAEGRAKQPVNNETAEPTSAEVAPEPAEAKAAVTEEAPRAEGSAEAMPAVPALPKDPLAVSDPFIAAQVLKAKFDIENSSAGEDERVLAAQHRFHQFQQRVNQIMSRPPPKYGNLSCPDQYREAMACLDQNRGTACVRLVNAFQKCTEAQLVNESKH